MFACKACGGKVIYDIELNRIRCEYCGNTSSVQEFDESTAQNVSSYETNVFVCSNCGAEVSTPDNQAVSFCSYCGSQSVLFSKTQQSQRPRDIIPFRVSKKAMHSLYQEKLSKVLYLPKEFTDPRYIDSMRGIYIPFHAHSVTMPDSLPITVERSTDISSTQYRVDTFQAIIHPTVDQGRYYTDASSSLDDTITDTLLPYPDAQAEPFNPAYLAGYYADSSDVPAEKYMTHVQEMASDDTIKAATTAMGSAGGSYTIVKELNGKPKGYPNGLPVACKSYHSTLMPVWFLTRRDKDRVSYAVANGATGKIFVDLPVDKKKYWLVTAAMAAVIFVLLALIVNLTARTSLGYISIMTTLMLFTYKSELRKVMERENHIFDIGHPLYNPAVASAQKKKNTASSGSGIIFLIVVGIMTFFIADEMDPSPLQTLLSTIMCFVQMSQILKYGRQIQKKSLGLVGIFSAVCVSIGFLLLVANLASDIWYYTASILCMAGAILPGALMIDCYNLIASRPLPNYFHREGGLNNAK